MFLVSHSQCGRAKIDGKKVVTTNTFGERSWPANETNATFFTIDYVDRRVGPLAERESRRKDIAAEFRRNFHKILECSLIPSDVGVPYRLRVTRRQDKLRITCVMQAASHEAMSKLGLCTADMYRKLLEANSQVKRFVSHVQPERFVPQNPFAAEHLVPGA